jgi:hypothetical protein
MAVTARYVMFKADNCVSENILLWILDVRYLRL